MLVFSYSLLLFQKLIDAKGFLITYIMLYCLVYCMCMFTIITVLTSNGKSNENDERGKCYCSKVKKAEAKSPFFLILMVITMGTKEALRHLSQP